MPQRHRWRNVGSGKLSERANAPPAAAEAAGRDVGPFSAACYLVSGRLLKKVQVQGGARRTE
jgi:hypothetical protein